MVRRNRSGFFTWYRPALLMLCLLPAACARHAGEQAARGAFTPMQEAQQMHPESAPLVEAYSAGVVRGSLRELQKPAQQAELRSFVDVMTRSALGTAIGQPSG